MARGSLHFLRVQLQQNTTGFGQGRSKLFKSAGDGCSLFVNNKKDEFNDRRVQKV